MSVGGLRSCVVFCEKKKLTISASYSGKQFKILY